MTAYIGGPDEEKLVEALRRAIDEHGAPNTFYPRELWVDYRGPHQMIIGLMLRREPIRLDISQHIGRTVSYELPTGRGHGDGYRVVVGGGCASDSDVRDHDCGGDPRCKTHLGGEYNMLSKKECRR